MPREPHVIHTSPAFFGDGGVFGGGERYTLELARHMAERVPTTLLCFGDQPREETLGALRVKVMRPRFRVRGQEHNRFSFAFLREVLRADVVHVHQQHVFVSSMAALAARAAGRRVFVSDLGGGAWDVSAYVSTDRWYDGHLHISQYSRRIAGHDGASWAHVIYGGVDTDKFRPGDAPARDRRTILFVGRLMAHKGVNDLVEAVTPSMRLELLGRPYDARFVADLHRLAEGKQVHFRTDASDDDLVRAYQGAACVVLPSVYQTMYGGRSNVPELLGQTLLEGMACGIPAICTDVASMPEVVDDGVTGFVVPPNDPAALRAKLEWLLAHPDEAEKMGAAARRRVTERFRWDNVVDRCLAIYDSVRDRGARAA